MWLTAFLDLPASTYDDAVAFWRAVTGSGISSSRGEHDEFATLLPPDGDPCLRVQRLAAGPARVHLDLHALDPTAVRARAEELGARLLHAGGNATYASPAGLVLCVVRERLERRPAPVARAGHTSLVDQVCLDLPLPVFDAEAAFWAALLDRALDDRPGQGEFARLESRPEDPLRVLLQRLGDGPAGAHLDLACTDRDAEVARLQALGAGVVRRTNQWTTLRDPAGLELCVTDRDPVTGGHP